MNITDIRIRKIYEDARLKALVSVTIDGDLAVHDIKVIEGPERLFVAMPSRKDENGTFRDIAHPITPEARHTLEEAILDRYQTHLAQLEAEQAATPHIPAYGCIIWEERTGRLFPLFSLQDTGILL